MAKQLKSMNSAPAAVQSMDDYQAQDDLSTLMRAHRIKQDPKRHAKAQALAGQHVIASKAIMKKG